jgi:kynurenine formamidase
MPSSSSSQAAGRARLRFGTLDLHTDFSRGLSLAIEQRFGAVQLQCFGAAPARSTPMAVGSFTGSVRTGASCNCSTLTLTPHCNGTHTECAGHLTAETLDVLDVLPTAPLLALLVSVEPEHAAGGDRVIGGAALERAWRAAADGGAVSASAGAGATAHGGPGERRATALVLRTLPNDSSKATRNYDQLAAPYLSLAAAEFVVQQGIEHLVLDLPSADRLDDGGALAAHRCFFGMPATGTALADARRAHCTLTELAFIADSARDGWHILQLHAPALGGDAIPSRPMLYPVLTS